MTKEWVVDSRLLVVVIEWVFSRTAVVILVIEYFLLDGSRIRLVEKLVTSLFFAFILLLMNSDTLLLLPLLSGFELLFLLLFLLFLFLFLLLLFLFLLLILLPLLIAQVQLLVIHPLLLRVVQDLHELFRRLDLCEDVVQSMITTVLVLYLNIVVVT